MRDIQKIPDEELRNENIQIKIQRLDLILL